MAKKKRRSSEDRQLAVAVIGALGAIGAAIAGGVTAASVASTPAVEVHQSIVVVREIRFEHSSTYLKPEVPGSDPPTQPVKLQYRGRYGLEPNEVALEVPTYAVTHLITSSVDSAKLPPDSYVPITIEGADPAGKTNYSVMVDKEQLANLLKAHGADGEKLDGALEQLYGAKVLGSQNYVIGDKSSK